jgi:hypothetical protein
MELTELLPHVARGLNINWDEAIRYAGLNAEFWATWGTGSDSAHKQWDEISGRETTLVDNEVNNLTTTISSKLGGLTAYRKHEQDEQAMRRLIQQLDQCAQQGSLQSWQRCEGAAGAPLCGEAPSHSDVLTDR